MNWNLDDSLETVTVTFPTNPPITLRLTTADVETVLTQLGMFRGLMKPPIQAEWQPGQKCEFLLDPKWMTEPEALSGDTLLHIRDPRYGWLHYAIPRETARVLQTALAVQVDAPPPGEGLGLKN